MNPITVDERTFKTPAAILLAANVAVLAGLYWLTGGQVDGAGGPLAEHPTLAIVVTVAFGLACLPPAFLVAVLIPAKSGPSQPPRLYSAMCAQQAREYLAAGDWDRATGAIYSMGGVTWAAAERDVAHYRRKAGDPA